MLVELTWAAGRLVREYTVLLDPPEMRSTQPLQAAAPETKPLPEGKTTAAVQLPEAQPTPQPVPAPVPVPVVPTISVPTIFVVPPPAATAAVLTTEVQTTIVAS